MVTSNQTPIPSGNSIIYDTNAYQWQSPPFTAPPLGSLMIYEMEIATLQRRAPGGCRARFNPPSPGSANIVSLGFNAVEIMPVNENPAIIHRLWT